MANEVEMTALSETEKDCEMQFAGTSPQIIVEGTAEKPYYNIMYLDAEDGTDYVGFGSYDLENVFGWLKEYFGEDRAKIVDGETVVLVRHDAIYQIDKNGITMMPRKENK